MTCRDVMTSNPQFCVPMDTVARAAQIMRQYDVGPVPVVNDHGERRITGIITDRDLALQVVAMGRDPNYVRVEEVMTRSPETCRADDDYHEALEKMARNQVRRIPVVDERGCLVGIIAQADVARLSSEEEVGEVVEDISQPSGNFLTRSFRRSGSSYKHSEAQGSDPLRAVAIGSLAMGLGVGLMYMLDPARGRYRRSVVRDKAYSLYSDVGYAAGKVQRDMRNRMSGVVAAAKSKVSSEDTADDRKLEARIRSRMGRVISHPRAVHVTVSGGQVTLDGDILASESSALLSEVRSVTGVQNVDNRLQVHESAEHVSSLQGGAERSGSRMNFMQSNWAPATRVVGGAIGGGLALYGLRSSGPVAKATALAGLSLLARAVMNRDIAELADIEEAKRLVGM
jgi:CBS domain-containing protein